MKKCLICLWILIISEMFTFGQNAAEKVRETAEFFRTAFNAKSYREIEARFNRQMREAVSGTRLTEFLDGLHRDLGQITKLYPPDFLNPTMAVFPAEFERGKLDLLVALDDEGNIAGLRLTPPAERPKNTFRNKTKMSLPFKGEWLVFWGGETISQNYHQDAPNQRFAFDFLKVDAEGKSHRGNGTENEDYYAFGQEIIAPADGLVSYLVDGIHDNIPGQMNKMFIPGNLIIIKHADDEYSLFAHIKQNSIRVKTGDHVTKGQTLGLCGNSGNSSEAHLHFQVQNMPFFENEASVKTFFEKITVRYGGKTEAKTDYSPVKGELIQN
jgi:murein DD-endopeptidase MepM/ murein hydrolase activator NlpD